MVATAVVQDFLEQHRLALVGASDNPKSFSNTIYRELRERGYDVVAVNPKYGSVVGDACYRDLASVPGVLDGVIVMVGRDHAADVVRDAAARGIGRVWLFKGLGSPGAVSDDALDECARRGIQVVDGACPLMFLEPVGWFHRAHRTMRRVNGSLAREP